MSLIVGVIRGGDHAVLSWNLAVGSGGKALMAAVTPSMRVARRPERPGTPIGAAR
jgi:hypothetical protein